jgi:hypothetical protein
MTLNKDFIEEPRAGDMVRAGIKKYQDGYEKALRDVESALCGKIDCDECNRVLAITANIRYMNSGGI